jgi:hypothetical protein
MTDIATLGLAVDSKSVTVASGELDDLSRSAKGAQASAGGLEAGSESLTRSTRQLSVAAQAAAASERTQSAAMRAATLSANDNAKAFRSLGARRQQFIYQSNDVISGLIMGQNPMMVATQQGGQIAQVYGGKGGMANAFEDAAFFAGGLIKRLGPLAAVMAVAAGGVTAMRNEINDTTDETVTFGDVFIGTFAAAGAAIGDQLAPAIEYVGPLMSAMWEGATSAAIVFIDYGLTAMLVKFEEARAAIELTGIYIQSAFDKSKEFLGVGQEWNNTINAMMGTDLSNPIEPVLTATEKANKALAESQARIAAIYASDPASDVFDAIKAQAILAKGRREAKEAEKDNGRAARQRMNARERALEAIGRQEERLSQRRLKESGREIDLIKARAQESIDNLDALAAKAIANGANEAEVNARVNLARRDAIIAADQEIYSFRQEQIEKELQDQIDAAQKAAQVKKQIEQFNSGLASQGVFGPADISGSPFANQAQGLGAGAVEGIGGVLQQEQERLAQLQEFENQKRAIIGNNQAEILAMEAQFEATRAAIKQDSLEQQTSIIQQSKEQLAAGVANDLGTLTNAMGSILGEQSDAYRILLTTQKAAAFAQAAIAAPAAAANAMATVPFPANILAAAAVYGNVIALGAQIGQVAIGGRQFGGATTGGTPYEINEDGRPEIYQQGNKKYLLSGSNGQVTPEPRMQQAANDRSGGGVNIQIVNNGSGVAVRKESLSNGDVRMIIEDMVPSMIAQEAPQVMAKQVSNANSTFSNAMTQNTQTARRRP